MSVPLRLTEDEAARLAAGADVLLDLGVIDVPAYKRFAACSRTRLYWPSEAAPVALALECYDGAPPFVATPKDWEAYLRGRRTRTWRLGEARMHRTPPRGAVACAAHRAVRSLFYGV